MQGVMPRFPPPAAEQEEAVDLDLGYEQGLGSVSEKKKGGG